MSEGVFNVVAFGRQTTIGSAVAASTIFPVDGGFGGFELDRATESPEQDFGVSSREYSSLASHGVRWATASIPFVARYENLMHAFEMHVDTIGTPVGTASPYTWTYVYDESSATLSSALKAYTIEYGVDGSTQDEWRAYGVVANELEMGFDALSAPGNMMWRGTLGLVGLTREYYPLTGTATVPSSLETLEGHYTILKEGPTGTAFASLTELSGSLKQFRFRSTNNAVGRVYGGTTDMATAIGRGGRGEVEFDALIAINTNAKSDILDIFEVAGGAPTERRWSIIVDGGGVNELTINFRCRFQTVNVELHESERLYAVNGVWIYDTTLAGRGQFILKNATAAIP